MSRQRKLNSPHLLVLLADQLGDTVAGQGTRAALSTCVNAGSDFIYTSMPVWLQQHYSGLTLETKGSDSGLSSFGFSSMFPSTKFSISAGLIPLCLGSGSELHSQSIPCSSQLGEAQWNGNNVRGHNSRAGARGGSWGLRQSPLKSQ